MRTVALLLFAVLVACGREVRTDEDAPIDAAPAALRSTVETTAVPIGAVGGSGAAPSGSQSVLYSERDAEVAARASGVVAEVFVELGDPVHAGQLLARLDNAEQAAELAEAEAAHELAVSEHARVVPLQEAELVEAAALDRAVFAVRSARARRDHAKALLDHTLVRAPFDGLVSRRFVRLAQNVATGDPLFRVTAMSPLRVRLMVPEREALRLEPGQEAALHGAAGAAAARVLRVSPAVDPAGGTVEVLLEVPRPGALRPGTAVRVEWR